MPRPFARYADRCNVFVRQWRLLVLLRRGPKSLKQLSRALDCHERTVRRDLYALQAAGLPITSRFAANEGTDPSPLKDRPWRGFGEPEPNAWFICGMAEWPNDEVLPVDELRAG
jgi:predicted DNA-binding transcriptional regulator YafY